MINHSEGRDKRSKSLHLAARPARRLPAFLLALPALLSLISGCQKPDPPLPVIVVEKTFRSELVRADQVDERLLKYADTTGLSSLVLLIESLDPAAIERDRQAAELISQAGFDLYYWIEVARSPSLADEHPEWMASLQGHGEWRRLFPDAEETGEGEVMKVYPWVPIFSQEGFTAHRQRIRDLLDARPESVGVLLNDLQGAPSACGCGNPLCRWTLDYGPVKTATPYEGPAAADFLAEMKRDYPERDWIPVWTSECEEVHGSDDGLCAGVGCFKGICWKALTEQLEPVAAANDQIGLLLLEETLLQDNVAYDATDGWGGLTVNRMQTMNEKLSRPPVMPDRWIAVVEGWQAEPTNQRVLEQLGEAGVDSWIIARTPLDQAWTPKRYSIP